MEIRGFHHLAILAHDVDRLSRFYSEVLGFPEKKRHYRDDGSLRSVWVGVPNSGFLAIEAITGWEGPKENSSCGQPAPGLHLIAFGIDARHRGKVTERLRANGVTLERQSQWTVYFRDPEGNRIALSHHPEDPPPGVTRS